MGTNDLSEEALQRIAKVRAKAYARMQDRIGRLLAPSARRHPTPVQRVGLLLRPLHVQIKAEQEYAVAVFEAIATECDRKYSSPLERKECLDQIVTDVVQEVDQLRGGGTQAHHLAHVRRALQGARLLWEAKREAAASGESSTPSSVEGRRAMVDAFLERVRNQTDFHALRTHIWGVAGYKDDSEFQRWQRNDPHTRPGTDAKIHRVLKMDLHTFVTKSQKFLTRHESAQGR